MKKLLVYICTLMIAFMFVSCQNSTKSTPPATPTEIHKVSNGVWNGTVSWSSAFRTGSYGLVITVQEGIVIIESQIGEEIGTLEGNIIHLKSTSWDDLSGSRDIKVYYPDRDYIISENGSTITINFQGTWNTQEIDDVNGTMEVKGMLTRE